MKDVEFCKRFNKLRDYNDIGRNLPSPPEGFTPRTLFNNNNHNDNNDDNDFPPTDLNFPHSSRMPPVNNIPQVPFFNTANYA